MRVNRISLYTSRRNEMGKIVVGCQAEKKADHF
jgi:hypothetical protein